VTQIALKDKIMNIFIQHPKLVTFGIGPEITFVIGIAIGMLDHNQFEDAFSKKCSSINNNG